MKNLNIALSAVMLLGVVSAVNGACPKCVKRAAAKVAKVEAKAKVVTREANAQAIKSEVFGAVELSKPKCCKKGCAVCKEKCEKYEEELKKQPKFKYSANKKYMGALVTNAEENCIKVFNLDTKERVLYLLPSTKMRDFDFKEDSNEVVVKWVGMWRTETTYSLGEACKKCGKTRRVGRVKKTRSLWGWAPCA